MSLHAIKSFPAASVPEADAFHKLESLDEDIRQLRQRAEQRLAAVLRAEPAACVAPQACAGAASPISLLLHEMRITLSGFERLIDRVDL